MKSMVTLRWHFDTHSYRCTYSPTVMGGGLGLWQSLYYYLHNVDLRMSKRGHVLSHTHTHTHTHTRIHTLGVPIKTRIHQNKHTHTRQ